MTREEIDGFAEKCELTSWSEWDGGEYQEYFYKFAALAYEAGAKAEREECKKEFWEACKGFGKTGECVYLTYKARRTK